MTGKEKQGNRPQKRSVKIVSVEFTPTWGAEQRLGRVYDLLLASIGGTTDENKACKNEERRV